MDSDKLISSLNPQQQEAVVNTIGPMVVLAGAGSGKTRVLTAKVAKLIADKVCLADEIMMVTFTNKAAAEMKERVGRQLGFIGTFHSFGARILRENAFLVGLHPGFVLYDENDHEELSTKVIVDTSGKKSNSASHVSNKISGAKDALLSASEYASIISGPSGAEIANYYQIYQERLKANNAVDFDDLIYLVVKLLDTNREVLSKLHSKYKYFLIDEFQDTNYAQYLLSKLLANQTKNITVVGDFSQSIYSWRGADIANLSNFSKDFEGTKIIYLEKNYRSTAPILDFAYEVISKNESHPILRLHTDKTLGEEVEVVGVENEEEEALFVIDKTRKALQAGGRVAVLYRINAQSRLIEGAFLRAGLPYILVGGVRFYERKEVKDLLSYLRLILNPSDEISLKRAEKIGKRKLEAFFSWRNMSGFEGEIDSPTIELLDKVKEVTQYLSVFDEDKPEEAARLENIKELRGVAMNHPILTEFLETIALVESEYSASEKLQKDDRGVVLMTMHACKGLEFETVIIVGAEEGIIPHSRSLEDRGQMEEERRLFYVAVTRAMQNLFITYTKKRFFFGRRSYSEPSRFIKDRLKNFDPAGEEIIYF